MTVFSFITQPDSLQDTFPDLFKPISQEPFQHDFTKLSIVLNQLFEFSGNAFRVILQPSLEHQPGHEFPGNVVVIDREILKQPKGSRYLVIDFVRPWTKSTRQRAKLKGPECPASGTLR